MLATMLVHGAFITSVGLAAATWVKRQGRAAAIGVIVYVLMTFGWPIMIIALVRGLVVSLVRGFGFAEPGVCNRADSRR